jgi:hypothetical protein
MNQREAALAFTAQRGDLPDGPRYRNRLARQMSHSNAENWIRKILNDVCLELGFCLSPMERTRLEATRHAACIDRARDKCETLSQAQRSQRNSCQSAAH